MNKRLNMKRKIVFYKILQGLSLLLLFLMLMIAERHLDPYLRRIINLIAINIIWAVSYNLLYGYTNQFSLGHAGFIAIGAYTTALLTMSPLQKEQNFFLVPCIKPLNDIQFPFFPSLVIAAILGALGGILIGVPSLQFRGDYMAIVTLGFSEIIRVISMNLQSIANGSLGLKGIPEYTNLLWSWSCVILTIFIVRRLINSKYGRAFKAIREDEMAAEAMGINVFRYKLLAFVVASMFASLGGGLLANLLSTVDPNLFSFFLSYQIVAIVVLGGVGSITGSILASIIYVSFFEILRPLDAPIKIGALMLPGRPGMRMVIFSALFIAIILFYRKGLMGSEEFSWQWLNLKLRHIFKKIQKGGL
ncbi:MAG: branched-chain amino acid ABC transporter permease [Conexivisphaerales archaeon]